MHEIALSTQLAHAVLRAAGDARVLTVRIEVGALRQVVPETLDYAWSFVVKGTALADARLEIAWIPLQIACDAGHVTQPIGQLDMHCPVCGLVGNVIRGREFKIIDIDVVRGKDQ